VNDKTTLRIERTFQAPAQGVFDACTSESEGWTLYGDSTIGIFDAGGRLN